MKPSDFFSKEHLQTLLSSVSGKKENLFQNQYNFIFFFSNMKIFFKFQF